MGAEPFYTWTDKSGKTHVVRAIEGSGVLHRVGENGDPVLDVQDTTTGEIFKAVPAIALVRLPFPPK